MKEKLELKHLAPYLPYGLQAYGASDIWNITGLNQTKLTIKNAVHTQLLLIDDFSVDYDVILRSLADLNKPEYEADRNELSEMDMECIDHNHIFYSFNNESTLVEHVSFDRVQYLISKHYDIFNLIPSGLAIDINTLKK